MYLVIGATEMIGAHILCSLLRQCKSVKATKKLGDNTNYTKHILSFYSDDYELLFNEIEWVEVDYDSPESMENALQGVCKTFICLTPHLSTIRDINDNVYTIRNILNSLANSQCKYTCYLSSVLSLGDEPDLKEITETSQRNPKGNYTDTSNAYYYCEMEVWRAIQEGLRAGILNASTVIGPGDWKTDSSFYAADQSHRNYYNDGVTGFVGINDLVKCMMTMVKQEIVNENYIVNSQNVCDRDILGYFNKCQNRPLPSKHVSNMRHKWLKLRYGCVSIFTGRRPIVDEDYMQAHLNFRLYSNRKSVGKLISSYQSIDEVIEKICQIYKKDTGSGPNSSSLK